MFDGFGASVDSRPLISARHVSFQRQQHAHAHLRHSRWPLVETTATGTPADQRTHSNPNRSLRQEK
eukprot:6202120-Pleurochrysis_carterae.AAC.2